MTIKDRLREKLELIHQHADSVAELFAESTQVSEPFAFLSGIPEGWYLVALRDIRKSPVAGRKSVRVHWECCLQYIDGGGKLCRGQGETPELAFDAALAEVALRDQSSEPSYTELLNFSAVNRFGDVPASEHDVYTVEHFKESCEDYSFIDSDGFGNPVKGQFADPAIVVLPSELDSIPPCATHIVWYNQ